MKILQKLSSKNRKLDWSCKVINFSEPYEEEWEQSIIIGVQRTAQQTNSPIYQNRSFVYEISWKFITEKMNLLTLNGRYLYHIIENTHDTLDIFPLLIDRFL